MNKTIRKAVLTALLVGAATVAATTAPKIEAATSSSCTYYSDASHTTVVGQYGKDCCNNTVAWGSKTAYSVCGGCFICYPPPPR
ncbi:MAG TPA: DUF6289 family protein [Thermoanaerobaculia bacterium]|jgi:hypothetical protein|nr:DUF6289 family protein [Thermoanaerobaculia bacterium]